MREIWQFVLKKKGGFHQKKLVWPFGDFFAQKKDWS
jgi:hypothetical protein